VEIHLLLRDIDLSCPANGEERRRAWAAPLQRLEIMKQLAIHPLTQGEQLFPESAQMILDSKALDLRAISSLQLDAEGFLSEALVLD
jgi:hypothetical protein